MHTVSVMDLLIAAQQHQVLMLCHACLPETYTACSCEAGIDMLSGHTSKLSAEWLFCTALACLRSQLPEQMLVSYM